jgi:hypothetical protein
LSYLSGSQNISVGTSAFSGINVNVTIQGTAENCVIPNTSTSTTSGIFSSLSTIGTTVTIDNPINTGINTI